MNATEQMINTQVKQTRSVIETCGPAFFLCTKVINPDGTERPANVSMELNERENTYTCSIFTHIFQLLGNIRAPNQDLIVILHPEVMASIPPEKARLAESLCDFIDGYFNAVVYRVANPANPLHMEISPEQVPGPAAVTLDGYTNTMLIEITPTLWSFRAITRVNAPDGTHIEEGVMIDEIPARFDQMVDELVASHGSLYQGPLRMISQ